MFTTCLGGVGGVTTIALTAMLSGAAAVASGQSTPPPQGQAPPGGDMKELSKATQNPVGDLISLPFQFNFYTGGDLEDRTLLNVNFQPVIPIKVSDEWSVIARTIVPMDSIPTIDGSASGLW
jgi:hypothetical protein